MKYLAYLLLLLSSSVFSQSIVFTSPPDSWELLQGGKIVRQGIVDKETCLKLAREAIESRLAPLEAGSIGYLCRTSVHTTGTKTKAAPPPPPPPPPAQVGLGTLPANPIVSPGWSTARITTTSDRGVPASDGVGAFRTVCNTSHYSFDDPIVYPGQPGRSHMHMFFGNTLTNAASTTTSLLNSGNGTCAGGILNRSAYWIPTMIDTATGQVVPAVPDVVFYYKTEYSGVTNQSIRPFPTGLRMIAGDATNKTENWTRAYQWVCHSNYPQHGFTMQNCAVGDELELKVFFPQCWDGVNLDSPDHKSHMAYAQGGCPASHPVPLPGLSVNVRWAITRPNQVSTWRLSSDVYSGPAGYSAHADFWAAWDPATMKTFVENCINRGQDCHAYLLGNGQTLY